MNQELGLEQVRSSRTFSEEYQYLREKVPEAFPPISAPYVGARVEHIEPALYPRVAHLDWASQRSVPEEADLDLPSFLGTDFVILPFEQVDAPWSQLSAEAFGETFPGWVEMVEGPGQGAAYGASLAASLGSDAFGVYLPFHYFFESPSTPWGIYMFAENLGYLAALLGERLAPRPPPENCLALAWHLVYRHELFHFHVERFATKAEIIAKRPIYRTYDENCFHPKHGAPEESLANSVVVRSKLVSTRSGIKSSVWRPAVQTLFEQMPEPYNQWDLPLEYHLNLAAEILDSDPTTNDLLPEMVTPWKEYQANDQLVPGYLLGRPAFLSRFQLPTPKRHRCESFLRDIGATNEPGGPGDHERWRLQTGKVVQINYRKGELDLASMKALARELGLNVRQLDQQMKSKKGVK